MSHEKPLRLPVFLRIRRAVRLAAVCCAASISAAAIAGDLAFSDPANTAPAPSWAIGVPSRDPHLDVQPGFRNPPPGYGEVGFYWWVGDPLTRERLEWQLQQLEGKGVMGLQINYAHTDRGGLTYGLTMPSNPALFSEPWWKLLDWFLPRARQSGMSVSLSDYTLGIGQGWLIDELLKEKPELEGAVLEQTTRDAAPGELQWPVHENTISIVAYELDGNRIKPGQSQDLRPFLKDRVLRWTVPDGPHRIVAVHVRPVKPSLDPMHPESGAAYAKKFFGAFGDRYPAEAGKGLNFFFSDELEFRVQGRLWNARYADEFKRRKGYDVLGELPALWHDIGPRTPKVRLDYSDVQVSLTEEGFFKPVFEWHQQRGMIYGCDHGGRGRNVTEFGDYFRTQRWNQGPGCDQPGLGRDLIKNKVASSISHLYQRPRVWLEGYYGSGWGTSSEALTDATFANFAQGQNLLTLHGLYYSTHGGWWEWAPPCNHFRQPYWAHMGEFLLCVQRMSYLLSQGTHRCDAAVLYPVAAVEADLNGGEAVQTAFATGESLYARGIDFDFMDFESLDRATIADGRLHVSGESYRVLILPAMRAVRFSTLKKALEFQRAGGLVINVGAKPEASDREGRDDVELNAMVRGLFDGGDNAVGTAAEVPNRIAKSLMPDFAVLTPGAKSPNFMHRHIGDRDVFMVHGIEQGTECRFRVTGSAELWNPWTGNVRPLPVSRQTNEFTEIRMPLAAAEAQIVVFKPGSPEVDTAAPKPAWAELPIEGEWEFELKPTMDNRWGDYRWPPAPQLLAAEARQLRYREETGSDQGWQAATVNDTDWQRVSCSFGPHFSRLGPVPNDFELPASALSDRTQPVDAKGKSLHWTPWEFSWRFGLEHDPGHQGYHGLKEQVHDDLLTAGKQTLTGTDSAYQAEEAGSRYYFLTSVIAPRAGTYYPLCGSVKPAAIWVNDAAISPDASSIPLNGGGNRLLLRYDGPMRSYFVILSERPSETESGRDSSATMATRWYQDPRVLKFDTRESVSEPCGWYRFRSAPGLRGLSFRAFGSPRVWIDGVEQTVVEGPVQKEGCREYRVGLNQPVPGIAQVAVRLKQERGYYGGAAIPEPISLNCAPGRISPGDWSKIDGLACYSGGAWYRTSVTLRSDQLKRRAELDLGNLVSSAEVHINGQPVGVRMAPPWKFDVDSLLHEGPNRIEVLVYNTAGNHYATIPTRYHGTTVSGLLGPVILRMTDDTAPDR